VLLDVPFAVLAVAPALRGAEPAEVARLIDALRSDKYAEREAATKALDALGAPALDALRKAARGDDPETRRRAAALVRLIERRAEVAEALEPRRVRLRYDNTPLADALDDFGKKTGVGLKLQPDKAKAEGRQGHARHRRGAVLGGVRQAVRKGRTRRGAAARAAGRLLPPSPARR